jgi:hypothetical protein
VPPCAALAKYRVAQQQRDDGRPAPDHSGDNVQAALVARSPSAIGYVALPDARANGFGQTTLDSRFWLRLDNGSGTFTEPSSAAANLSTKGANCARWSTRASPQERTRRSQTPCENVSGVNTRTAYAICTLSYELAWNNASTVYGNTSTDEKRQHKAKDFLGYDLSTSGENVPPTRDYAKLPARVLAVAQGGQQRVCWISPAFHVKHTGETVAVRSSNSRRLTPFGVRLYAAANASRMGAGACATTTSSRDGDAA